MNKEIIIERYGLGHAVVALHNGKIVDCFIDPPQGAGFYPPNTFVRAFIDRKAPGMGGYFVKLPKGIQGFLKSKNKYKEGSSILLRSQLISEPHKPQTFTDILKTISKYFVIKIGAPGYSFSKKLPDDFDKSRAAKLLLSKVKNYENIFIICRSNAASINFLEFDQEAEKAINHLQTIKATLDSDYLYFDGLARKVSLQKYSDKLYKVKEGEGVFDQLGIWERLEAIKSGNIYLNAGSYLIFEQTSAFVSIDVNSGKDFKSTKDEINLNACYEIARIIRICGFGGKILIDFLPCSQALRKKIYGKITSYFSKDTVKIKIWGWTKSGIFELERQREKIPLELLI